METEPQGLHSDEASALLALVSRHSRPVVKRAVHAHGGARDACQALGINWQPEPRRVGDIMSVTVFDDDFPAALGAIPDAPLVLYVKGNARVLDRVCVAVVGARRCTAQGREIAQTIARGLVDAGLGVVSGLALGIDASAHLGSLQASVAVLGGGLDRIQPATNAPLGRRLLDQGSALVSEYPVGVRPQKYHFPERNRLISGLSAGVVVVEATRRSGSLITARFALEQGRDVMAVPGTIRSETAEGCHELIRSGASLVTNSDQVLEVLGMRSVGLQPRQPQIPPEHQATYDLLGAAPQTLDELAATTELASETLIADLVHLELAGFVQQIGDGYIRRPLR